MRSAQQRSFSAIRVVLDAVADFTQDALIGKADVGFESKFAKYQSGERRNAISTRNRRRYCRLAASEGSQIPTPRARSLDAVLR